VSTLSLGEPSADSSSSFDICEDTGGASAFFPSGHGALLGTWSEVSCSLWTGSGDGSPLWNGACISGEKAPLWPSTGCGNQGLPLADFHTLHADAKAGLAPGASGWISSDSGEVELDKLLELRPARHDGSHYYHGRYGAAHRNTAHYDYVFARSNPDRVRPVRGFVSV
jgi:hypothetical protein